ncbi:MAG: nucleotidyltransferase domain-containing protein [Phycisphaeraceae bacterium]|nr:MAG: nucleotidyltransferase domain-containing protein [Phycisphaeraceae bacterium]
MTPDEAIQEITRRLVEKFDPSRVILFGSRARGDAGQRSDFDFIILVDDISDRFGLATAMYEAKRGVPVGCDFVVATEQEYENERETPGTVFYYADREKRVLYERAA